MAEPQSRNNCDLITPRKSKESGGRDSANKRFWKRRDETTRSAELRVAKETISVGAHH
jgi:hypothetical protein